MILVLTKTPQPRFNQKALSYGAANEVLTHEARGVRRRTAQARTGIATGSDLRTLP